jgi:hypothetical protein
MLLERCMLIRQDPFLSQAGFVHRDLRWENVACIYGTKRWYLLDLEACCVVDKDPQTFRSVIWDSNTLVGGLYTVASDLHLLGMLINKHCSLLLSEDAISFLQLLTRPAAELGTLSADELLRHSWINCPGTTCRDAGADPGEH